MSKQSYRTFFNVTFFVAVFFISLSFFPKHAHAETTIPLSVELMCSSQDPFITVYFDAIVEDDGYITGNGVYTHPTNGKSMHLVFSGSWDRQEKYIHADIKRYYNDVNNSLTQLVRTNSFEGKFDKTTPLHSSIENDTSIDCTSYIRISVQQEDTSPATSVSDDDLYTPCHTYTALNPPSFSDFSPPYNVFSGNKENIIKARCNKNTAKIIFGDGSEDTYIWNTANITDPQTGKWIPLSLTGDKMINEEWIIGSTEVTQKLSEKQMKDGALVSAYICHYVDDEWKCGCSGNGKCSGKWQIERVKKKKRLLTTLWNQYKINSDLFDVDQRFLVVPGCTAVAVGQLVNYYFQNGYHDGWLDTLLGGGTIAYPRIGFDKDKNGEYEADEYEIRVIKDANFSTENQYIDKIDESNNFTTINEGKLINFLYYIGVALDANFEIGGSTGTSVGTYIGQEPYKWVDSHEQKLKSVLIDRIRFGRRIQVSEKLSKLSEEKDYIINSIDSSKPILMNIHGYRLDSNGKGIYTNGSLSGAGHTVIIDNYGFSENGKFFVKINMGWGDSKKTKKWYSTDSDIIIQWGSGGLQFNKFYIFKNTVPESV